MNNIFLLLTIISFLGIPFFMAWAVICMIRKRPSKKRFKYAGASALALVAGLIGFGITMDKVIEPEDIVLSIPGYQEEYDVNTEIPVNITVLPENADAGSLEYISDGGTLTFSESGIITGSLEGSFNIYVKSGDVTSDIISIHVVDIAAREEAERQRAAEEQALKEATQKRLEEEKAAEEAQRKRQEAEKAAEEAEQKRLREEKAAEEAEQKRAAEEKAAAETAQQKPSQEQAAAESQQTQTVQDSAAQANTSQGGTGNNFNTYDNASQQQTSATYVLNTNTHKIHYPSCHSVRKIAPQNYATSNSSVEELVGQGYTTCGNCF